MKLNKEAFLALLPVISFVVLWILLLMDLLEAKQEIKKIKQQYEIKTYIDEDWPD